MPDTTREIALLTDDLDRTVHDLWQKMRRRRRPEDATMALIFRRACRRAAGAPHPEAPDIDRGRVS